MTKYSKITKSTFAIIALSLILVAVLAFGGTYAYFSATTEGKTGAVTTATLTLDGDFTVATAEQTFVPNQKESISLGTLALGGTTLSALRINITVDSVTKADGSTLDSAIVTQAKSQITLDVLKKGTNQNWLTDNAGNYYYAAPVTTATIADIADVSVVFAKAADDATDNKLQGIKVNYTITVSARQCEYVGDTALSESTVTELTVWTEASQVAAFFN